MRSGRCEVWVQLVHPLEGNASGGPRRAEQPGKVELEVSEDEPRIDRVGVALHDACESLDGTLEVTAQHKGFVPLEEFAGWRVESVPVALRGAQCIAHGGADAGGRGPQHLGQHPLEVSRGVGRIPLDHAGELLRRGVVRSASEVGLAKKERVDRVETGGEGRAPPKLPLDRAGGKRLEHGIVHERGELADHSLHPRVPDHRAGGRIEHHNVDAEGA